MKSVVPFVVVMVSVCVVVASSAQERVHTPVSPVKDAGSEDEAPVSQANCPADMVEIQGELCENLEATCLYNVDIDGNRMPGPGNPLWSCGEFTKPTRCLSPKKTPMHYCIDRYEWPGKEGQKPQDWMTWYDAKREIEAAGKRMCTLKEWRLAAEGPDGHPLPYGDGYHRMRDVCNFDRHMPKGMDVFKARLPNDEMSQWIRTMVVASGSMPGCHSDYGVYDMAGNLDELVNNEAGYMDRYPYKSGLVGGHFWHVRNSAIYMTDAHGPTFGWYETSTRACLDIKESQ